MTESSLSNNFQTINVAGSKKIENDFNHKSELAKKIGSEIMKNENWILMNGGALGTSKNDATAIDYLTCLGARDELKKLGIDENKRIFTIHPKESEHPMHNIGKVEVTKRKNSTFRRFDLVSRADAIITIEGTSGTRQIIELAMAAEKPVLPIPCTGGQSYQAWEEYESEILNTFQIKKNTEEYEILHNGLETPAKLASVVTKIIKNRLTASCFIAMPLREEFNAIFDAAIAPALVSCGYNPIHPDRVIKPGNIIQQIIESIRKSSIFLADITGLNPNVMYELGMAHILGKPIILLSQTDNKGKSGIIPFDIATERVMRYDKKSLKQLKRNLVSVIEYIK